VAENNNHLQVFGRKWTRSDDIDDINYRIVVISSIGVHFEKITIDSLLFQHSRHISSLH